MDPRKPLGKHTAADLRDDPEGVEALARVVGLSTTTVAERIRSVAHGAVQVRNVFRDEWPRTPQSLGVCTAAFARAYGLHEEIRNVTGASRILVARRLNSAQGRRQLRNLFWDWWPDEQAGTQGTSELAATIRIPANMATAGDDETEGGSEPSGVDAVQPIGPGALLSGRYRIREKLGSGGFGTTWVAYDQLSGLDLVLKIPHAEDGGAIRNELRTAFRVVHPNICQAFPERDDDTGQPFLVMQHGGEDLARRLKALGGEPFPLAMAVHVLVSIADALDYLHDQLILHLDVSPANILLGEDDVVRLTDFGASARARTEVDPSGHQTRMATMLHSLHPCYAAPELYEGRARSRSDQYGLFRVFCSLLDGRVHTVPHYQFKPFPVLTDTQNAIVARALSQDPEQRYESCAEPARALADELVRVPEAVLASDIQRLAQYIVHRIDLEKRRIASNTVRLGGALRLGHGLERLLQGVLLWMGSIDGFDVLSAVQAIDPNASRIDRATSGTIAKTILARAGAQGSIAPSKPEIAYLIADLKDGKRGRIWSLINARNDVVHGRRPPDAILPAASALSELLIQARHDGVEG